MVDGIVRNDAHVQAAVQALFEGVAPERNDELKERWKKYSPRFNVLEDLTRDGRFVMDAGAYREVRFNHRALRAFWLASFIAWEGYRAVAEFALSGETKLETFRAMLECFERVLASDDSTAVPLPNGVPEPGILPDAKVAVEQRASAEIAIFAVGWAFLHEIRHLQHQQEGTAAAIDGDPAERRREELSCDEFASEFLLSQIGAYAKSEGVEAGLVRMKREIGIYFALFALTLLAKENWGESDSHPSMKTRIHAAGKIMESGTSAINVSDAIAHAAFAALRVIWPQAPAPFDPPDRGGSDSGSGGSGGAPN